MARVELSRATEERWFNPWLVTVLFFLGIWVFKDKPIYSDEHTFLRFSWRYSYDGSWSLMSGILYSLRAYHPPLHIELHLLYSDLLASLKAFTPFSFRVINIALSAASLGILFEVLQKRYRTGWASVVYAFSNYYFILFCWQIGPYALVLFLSSVYLVLVDRVLRDLSRGRPKSTPWLGVFLCVFVFSHYFSVLLVAITGCHLLWCARGKRIQGWLLRSYSFAGIAMASWLFFYEVSIVNPANYNAAPVFTKFPKMMGEPSVFATALFNLDQNFIFLVSATFIVVLLRGRHRIGLTTTSLAAVFLVLALVLLKSLVTTPILRPQLLLTFFPFLVYGVVSLPFKFFSLRRANLALLSLFLLLSFNGFMPLDDNNALNLQEANRAILRDAHEHSQNGAGLVRYYGPSKKDFSPYGVIDETEPLTVEHVIDSCPVTIDWSPSAKYIVFFNRCFQESVPPTWHPIFEKEKISVYRSEVP